MTTAKSNRHRRLLNRKFRTLLYALRAECPTSMGYPVYVRRREEPWDYYGSTNIRKDGKSFSITLATCIPDEVTGEIRPVTFGELQDTLIHEWAHAMAWTPEHHSVTDHDAAWGVAYAKAYAATISD